MDQILNPEQQLGWRQRIWLYPTIDHQHHSSGPNAIWVNAPTQTHTFFLPLTWWRWRVFSQNSVPWPVFIHVDHTLSATFEPSLAMCAGGRIVM